MAGVQSDATFEQVHLNNQGYSTIFGQKKITHDRAEGFRSHAGIVMTNRLK